MDYSSYDVREPRIEWRGPLGPTLQSGDGTDYPLSNQQCLWLQMGLTNVRKLDLEFRSDIPQQGS